MINLVSYFYSFLTKFYFRGKVRTPFKADSFNKIYLTLLKMNW